MNTRLHRSYLDRSYTEFKNYSPEDKAPWTRYGERAELAFIGAFGPALGLSMNPKKKTESDHVIDLIRDGDPSRLADLKVQNTPFFNAGKYDGKIRGVRYSAEETLTFNVKDALNYQEYLGRGLVIYYWVHWEALVMITREVDDRGLPVAEWLTPSEGRITPRSRLYRIDFDRLNELRHNRWIHWYKSRDNDVAEPADEARLLMFEPRLRDPYTREVRDVWSSWGREKNASCSYLFKFSDFERVMPHELYRNLAGAWMRSKGTKFKPNFFDEE